MKDLREAVPTPESIIGCSGCPFKTKRIGGRGPFDSPFVIVGESPGATELAKEVPFVGPSGQMMKEILEEAGFDRLGVEPYITNALSCYPMDKTIPKMQTATACCQGRLHQELLAHPREVILCLGASASWAVTGNYNLKITRDRGKVLPSNYSSKGVVLAVHPAYLMRNGGGLPFWKRDLKSAVDLMQGELQSHWQEPTWEVVKDRQALETVVADYTAKPHTLVTGDLETDGLQALFNRVLELVITKGAGNHVHVIPEDIFYGNLDLMKRLMESPNIKWNWQNGKFDIQWFWAAHEEWEEIRKANGHEHQCACCAPPEYKELLGKFRAVKRKPQIEARVNEDTMLLSYALNENSGFHDLDQIAQSWIQAPAHKGVMDKYYKMAPHYSLRNAPTAERHQYAVFDVAKTHKAWAPLQEALNKDPRLVRLYYKTLIPASGFFARMETHGVRVDKQKVQENVEIENAEIARINKRLQAYALEHLGREINFNSWQQVRLLLWKHMKLGPPGSDRGRNWFTTPSDEDALVEAQRRTNHPILHDLLENREVVKRKGTYVINLIDHYKRPANAKKDKFIPGITCPDGRVHANFLIHGTRTGRPAGRNPNMLNQPRVARIRDQYSAEPGKLFVEVDLNQAELRSLAILSKDPVLMDIYTKNEISIHDVTAKAFFASKEDMKADPEVLMKCAQLMQVYTEARDNHWTCEHCETPIDIREPHICAPRVYKEAKMAAKTVNFGIVYGREAHSIAQVFNLPHQEAQRWIDTWLETYAGAAEYIKRCRRTVSTNQRMVTPWGRMMRVGVASPEKIHDLENQAANFPHQSIAHDILLEAAMECEPRLLNEWDAHPWNEVYDAVYYEIEATESIVRDSIDYVAGVITEVPKRYDLTDIPFLGDAKIGRHWGSMRDWKGSFEATGFQLEDFQ